jgi:Na+-transporting NADH:ubiquinone oxidoreductase subunit NqrC
VGSTPATRTIFKSAFKIMKTAIPWILVVALLGGGYFLFAANQQKQAELDKQAQQLQDVDNLRAENEELKKIPAQNEELARLRKDNEDVLRLRGETQQLRAQVKQLTAQLATAQGQVSEAQAQQSQLTQLASENDKLKTQAGQLRDAQALADTHRATCINNLREIEGAKQQWALEKGKTADALPTPQDLAPYLPDGGAKLVCPDGGTYSINAVNVAPTCSVPGHSLAPL